MKFFPGQTRRDLGASCVLLVILAITLFPASGSDDAYLTFWQAYSLHEFGEILNYNGARVEQSSSLLFVILLAVLDFVSPLEIPTTARIFSLLMGLACLLSIQLAPRLFPSSFAPTRLAPFLLASALPVVYWSLSGMEATTTALIAIWVWASCSLFWLLLAVAFTLSVEFSSPVFSPLDQNPR